MFFFLSLYIGAEQTKDWRPETVDNDRDVIIYPVVQHVLLCVCVCVMVRYRAKAVELIINNNKKKNKKWKIKKYDRVRFRMLNVQTNLRIILSHIISTQLQQLLRIRLWTYTRQTSERVFILNFILHNTHVYNIQCISQLNVRLGCSVNIFVQLFF